MASSDVYQTTPAVIAASVTTQQIWCWNPTFLGTLFEGDRVDHKPDRQAVEDDSLPKRLAWITIRRTAE